MTPRPLAHRPAKAPAESPRSTQRADLEGITIGTTGPAGVGTVYGGHRVEAASIATSSGIPTVLTSAPNAQAVIDGQDIGTWFSVSGSRKPLGPHGWDLWPKPVTIIIGRRKPCARSNSRSLLPAGIAVQGSFDAGDPINICAAQTVPSSPAGWSTTPPASCP